MLDVTLSRQGSTHDGTGALSDQKISSVGQKMVSLKDDYENSFW